VAAGLRAGAFRATGFFAAERFAGALAVFGALRVVFLTVVEVAFFAGVFLVAGFFAVLLVAILISSDAISDTHVSIAWIPNLHR
jgi:hypothetical protein